MPAQAMGRRRPLAGRRQETGARRGTQGDRCPSAVGTEWPGPPAPPDREGRAYASERRSSMMLRPHRVVPKAYRDKLIQLVPPQRQLWLVRRLTQVTAARRSRTAPGEVRQVRDVDGHRVQARVVEEATPLALRQRNLDLVTRAFDKAGIDGFHVRHADDLRSAIAVPRKHRVKVLKVLARATSADGVTLRFVDSGRREVSASHRDAIAQVFHAVTDPFGHTVLGSAFGLRGRVLAHGLAAGEARGGPRSAARQPGRHCRTGDGRNDPRPGVQLSRFVPAGAAGHLPHPFRVRRPGPRAHHLPDRPRLHLGRR